MEWWEYLIIIAIIGFVIAIFFIHFYKKKKGQSTCDCCSGVCLGCQKNCQQKRLEQYRKTYNK